MPCSQQYPSSWCLVQFAAMQYKGKALGAGWEGGMSTSRSGGTILILPKQRMLHCDGRILICHRSLKVILWVISPTLCQIFERYPCQTVRLIAVCFHMSSLYFLLTNETILSVHFQLPLAEEKAMLGGIMKDAPLNLGDISHDCKVGTIIAGYSSRDRRSWTYEAA